MPNARVNRSKPDNKVNLYTTPEWATQALLHVEKFHTEVWEPCCGMGHISKVLANAGYQVTSTDKFNHGYGDTGVDFFHVEPDSRMDVVTNPPYDNDWIHMKVLDRLMSLEHVQKFALFLPVTTLENAERAIYFKNLNCHMTVYCFADRVACLTNGSKEESKNNTAKFYAWFVFDKSKAKDTKIDWLFKPEAMRTRPISNKIKE